MKIGYARVSTGDQTTDLQLDALKAAGCDRIFEDIAAGVSRSRPGLDQALNALGPKDQLVVWKLDRAGRSVDNLLEILRDLRGRGATFLSLTESIDTASPMGECFFTILAALASLERSILIERTVAGLDAARRRGQKLGRKPKLSAARMRKAIAQMEGGDPVAHVAAGFGVCRSTLYRHRNKTDASS